MNAVRAPHDSSTRRADAVCTGSVDENRRAALRYGLRAQVEFRWLAQDGTVQEARGCTRDIGPGGAYVFATAFPPVGATLNMSIRLPQLTGDGGAPSVEVKGRVLRVDRGSSANNTGFSVRTERAKLCAI
jgi:hypothetical protein